MQLHIQMMLTGSENPQGFPPSSAVVEVPASGPFLIDRFEQDVLAASHQVIRAALTQTLEAIMSQAAETVAKEQGGV